MKIRCELRYTRSPRRWPHFSDEDKLWIQISSTNYSLDEKLSNLHARHKSSSKPFPAWQKGNDIAMTFENLNNHITRINDIKRNI